LPSAGAPLGGAAISVIGAVLIVLGVLAVAAGSSGVQGLLGSTERTVAVAVGALLLVGGLIHGKLHQILKELRAFGRSTEPTELDEDVRAPRTPPWAR
jgi:hypothetical protein